MAWVSSRRASASANRGSKASSSPACSNSRRKASSALRLPISPSARARARRTERVVFDGDVKTHQDGFPQDGFYEGTEAWFAPEKLVSWQTGLLDVFVNITGFSSTPPIPATHYELYYHNATRLGIGCCDGDLAQDVDGKDDLKSYHFQVNVTSDGMDGPYQPASRWGFHAAAVTGAFSDSASYDIAYHIKIIARKAPNAQVPVT